MKKIAIIGSGISGLTCAHLLDERYEVTVFEKNDYVGGHTATIDVHHQGRDYSIDTGFIVFNDRTYPYFNRLLKRLGIARQPTEMSFSVHHCQSGFEYNGHNLNTLFAQRSNLVRPVFWQLIWQILKFNRLCKQAYTDNRVPAGMTLGDFLAQYDFSRFFAEHYILPMGAAIWSTSLAEMENFELKFFIQFFYNHGLLNVSDRPQWFVIPGGSRQYVDAILKQLSKPVLTNCQIRNVRRVNKGIEIAMRSGELHRFDEVIFACHSDQALALLDDPGMEECQILSKIPYSKNEVILHTDESLLPKRRRAWASWNYQLDNDVERPACVTYNMNILQGIQSDTTFCVTLNQGNEIDPAKLLRRFVYDHPILNEASVKAQQRRAEICGQRRTHYVGAYWYNGFHEDGVRSALDVSKRFGVTL